MNNVSSAVLAPLKLSHTFTPRLTFRRKYEEKLQRLCSPSQLAR